jgi:hypothetical protein
MGGLVVSGLVVGGLVVIGLVVGGLVVGGLVVGGLVVGGLVVDGPAQGVVVGIEVIFDSELDTIAIERIIIAPSKIKINIIIEAGRESRDNVFAFILIFYILIKFLII